jgi:hypothetical protein
MIVKEIEKSKHPVYPYPKLMISPSGTNIVLAMTKDECVTLTGLIELHHDNFDLSTYTDFDGTLELSNGTE